MANMTDTMEDEINDGVTGVSALFSANMSIACFTADPTETGSVANEYVTNGCARKLLSGLFSASSGGTSSNTSLITVATATADWTAITHVGFMESDVESTADMKVVIALDTPISILNGQAFEFALGTLTVNSL